MVTRGLGTSHHQVGREDEEVPQKVHEGQECWPTVSVLSIISFYDTKILLLLYTPFISVQTLIDLIT